MIRKGRITIVQVAEEAGVSKQTVSRVLNNRPDVAPETRQHVQSVIEQLDYKPSAVARSLIHQRSFTIGVVTAGLKFVGPSRTLNGITGKAEEMGYALLLVELSDLGNKEIQPTLDTLIAHRVDGIIWAIQEVGENRACFIDQGITPQIPTIFLTMGESPDLPCVRIDNYNSAKLITSHLIEQRCQHIGHIAGPLNWWEARQRKSGWASALEEASKPVSDVMWREGNWSSRSGEKAFQELLDKYPQIDGVFVGNDQMALGVLQAAHQTGIRIPQDLAVAGFDGIPESGFFWPPLTTVVQNQHELGCVAVRELVKMINAYRDEIEIKPKTLTLETKIAIRESSLKISTP